MSEVAALLAELETLMASLRVNVGALQAILAEEEAPDDGTAA